ncbi:MAG: HemK family protein methyltransferase [Actinobacteria bacterium]|nr:HemK family protein methyltransferase [Actinomycetota bacterium]
MERWTVGSLLETASGYLREKGSTSPRLDAELLLAETLGLDRVHLYTEYDRPLGACEVDRYRTLIGRRGRQEPVAYILGRTHFRHLFLEVNPAVLIPRPETEELVEIALGVLRRKPLWETLDVGRPATSENESGSTAAAGSSPPEMTARPEPTIVVPSAREVAAKRTSEAAAGPTLIADVGCGSGAIALSIAQETGRRVLATDASPEALVVAGRNREALGLQDLVELVKADLLDGVPDAGLRMVVSNPPYIASSDIRLLEPDVGAYEPLEALDGGEDGLAVFRRLLPEAARVLMPGGTAILEVGDGQAGSVAMLAAESGFAAFEIHKDLSGKDRIVEAARPGCEVFDISAATAEKLVTLASALQAGGLIGLPTDTVYGLASAWTSREGAKRLSVVKGRSEAQPAAVIFSSVESIRRALPDLVDSAYFILDSLLPGPFTFIVSTDAPRPRGVGTVDSLGVRVPNHPELLRFLNALDLPLAATSANISGQPAVATLADVDPALLARCSAALRPSADLEAGGVASTVVDLRPVSAGGRPIVVREGAVPASEVLRTIDLLG